MSKCGFTEMGELTHGERRRQGLTCPPDSAPAPAEVLPRGPSEVEEEEEEGVGGKEEEEEEEEGVGGGGEEGELS